MADNQKIIASLNKILEMELAGFVACLRVSCVLARFVGGDFVSKNETCLRRFHCDTTRHSTAPDAERPTR